MTSILRGLESFARGGVLAPFRFRVVRGDECKPIHLSLLSSPELLRLCVREELIRAACEIEELQAHGEPRIVRRGPSPREKCARGSRALVDSFSQRFLFTAQRYGPPQARDGAVARFGYPTTEVRRPSFEVGERN